MVAILRDVERLEADWLRRSVRPADAAAFSSLTSVRAERLGEGVGMLTNLHRLHLGYAPGAPPGPATLVLKLPSAIPEIVQMARAWHLYRREVLFYRDVAATVTLRVPKAYVTELDSESHDFVLVLEDVSAAVSGDQVFGLPLEHARLALEAIADLHASWWNRPELTALETAIQPFGEGPWAGMGSHLAGAWPLFRSFVAKRASPTLTWIGDRLAAGIEGLMVDQARVPRTLCHGDFRADNLLFSPGDHGPTLVTLDWQVALQARGALDVGQLLSGSVTTDLRRAHESTLLRGYHDRLRAGGVEDYPYEEFFRDYRRGLLITFLYVILPGATADLSHPRTGALYDSAVRRMDAAVQDHGLEAFLA